ncbi:MAG: ferritin-like fold-containing protein [Actinomycetaceae bacterium]|nr:ferritin-like fold-containing protein [Actinomycetaceae bacterium]
MTQSLPTQLLSESDTTQGYATIMYMMLIHQARLAKDAALAPDLLQQVQLSQMSAEAWLGFQIVRDHCENREDIRHMQALQLFHDVHFSEVEARLRPGDWWERVVKTYITIGSCHDFIDYIVERLGSANNSIPDEIAYFDYSLGHEQWVIELVSNATRDTTLAPRLSLWGRRVAGDLIALLSLVAAQIPALIPNKDVREQMHEYINTHHNERMARAGLAG